VLPPGPFGFSGPSVFLTKTTLSKVATIVNRRDSR